MIFKWEERLKTRESTYSAWVNNELKVHDCAVHLYQPSKPFIYEVKHTVVLASRLILMLHADIIGNIFLSIPLIFSSIFSLYIVTERR